MTLLRIIVWIKRRPLSGSLIFQTLEPEKLADAIIYLAFIDDLLSMVYQNSENYVSHNEEEFYFGTINENIQYVKINYFSRARVWMGR